MKERAEHEPASPAPADPGGVGPGDAASTEANEASSAASAQGDTLADLRSRVAELEERLLRKQADFQNFQRRTAIERAEAVRYANAELARSLLPVLDDFERCLQAAQSTDNLAAVVEGVRLVYENLCKALREHGLEPIDALHQPFDPTVHEAMMQQESTDHPAGTVVEEIARGYRLRDRVVRPSKVVVSKRPDHGQQDGGKADLPPKEGDSKG